MSALASVAIAAACGCGGSEAKTYSVRASTTMAAVPIDKAQFLGRVNGICRRAWGEVEENFAQYKRTRARTSSTTVSFAEAVKTSLLSSIDFHIFDAIRLLGAPSGELEAVEEIIGPMQFAVESGQEEEPASMHSVAQVSRLFGDYNQRAREYGLANCVVSPEHLSRIKP